MYSVELEYKQATDSNGSRWIARCMTCERRTVHPYNHALSMIQGAHEAATDHQARRHANYADFIPDEAYVMWVAEGRYVVPLPFYYQRGLFQVPMGGE